jgi:acetyl esterase
MTNHENAPAWHGRISSDMRAAFEKQAEFDRGRPEGFVESRRCVNPQALRYWSEDAPEVAAVEPMTYTDAEGKPREMVLYRGDLAAPAPVLLYIHGGGWICGGVAQNDSAIRRMVAESGWSVAAITYRLAPEYPFPAPLEDCVAAANWLAGNAESLGLDPRRLAVGGASAGGNLALATALDLPRDRFAALVLFYGVFGADFDTPSYLEFADTGPGLLRGDMRKFFDLYDPEGKSRNDPRLVPMLAELSNLPPTLVLAAELDVLRSDSDAMFEALTEAGVAAEYHLEPGVLHGYSNRSRMVEGSRRSLSRAASFLRSLAG